MPKGTSCAEVTSNSEKIKPVALAIVKLRLSEGIISQSGSQSVSSKFVKYIFFKFHSNLLKAFRVDLKACLVYLTNTASSSSGKLKLVLDDVILWATPTPSIQYYLIMDSCL